MRRQYNGRRGAQHGARGHKLLTQDVSLGDGFIGVWCDQEFYAGARITISPDSWKVEGNALAEYSIEHRSGNVWEFTETREKDRRFRVCLSPNSDVMFTHEPSGNEWVLHRASTARRRACTYDIHRCVLDPMTWSPEASKGQSSGCFRCWLRRFVIIPQVSSRRSSQVHWVEIWDVMIVLLLCVEAFRVPFMCAFFLHVATAATSWLPQVSNIIFTVDMALQFFIAYARNTTNATDITKAQWETDPYKIVARYCGIPFAQSGRAGWFWVDLVSMIPGWVHGTMSMLGMASVGHGISVLVLFRILRLIRMMRLERWRRFLERVRANVSLPHSVVDMTKFLFIASLATHWIACVWILFEGKVTHGLLTYAAEQQSWLSVLIEAKGDPCVPDAGSDPWCTYVVALYWSMMTLTTVGYGDITPQNRAEYVLCTVLMLITGFIWAWVVGSMVSLLASLSHHEEVFKRNMDDLNELMQDRGVPPELRVELRRYMQEARRVRRHEEQTQLLEGTISQGLQRRIIQCSTSNDLLRGVYWAQDIEDDARLQLIKAFVPMFFPPNEVVVLRQAILVMAQGLMAVKGHILRAGDTWGHENVLLVSAHLIENTRPTTLSYVSAMMLEKESLVNTAQYFPVLNKNLRRAQIRVAARRAFILRGLAERNLTRGGDPADTMPLRRVEVQVSTAGETAGENERASFATRKHLRTTFVVAPSFEGGQSDNYEALPSPAPAPARQSHGQRRSIPRNVAGLGRAHAHIDQRLDALEDRVSRQIRDLQDVCEDIKARLDGGGGGAGGSFVPRALKMMGRSAS